MMKWREIVEKIIASQYVAVLGTESGGQTYGNLIAFSATRDLSHFIFFTSRRSRKYACLRDNPRASILIDDRPSGAPDFDNANAVTAIGRVREANAQEIDGYREVYLERHPTLRGFASESDSALMLMTVTDYIIADFNGSKSVHISD
jgi:pyridoxine/pyridoxamine 5'-phosphate oxidase